MPLNIKNAHTEQLARQLAVETGESLTDAITHALEERLQHVRNRRRASTEHGEVHRILREYRKLPVLDERAPEAIIDELYDADGVPS